MDNLHIVNLASYNRPQIKEDKKLDYVKIGEDNNYYTYLIDLFTNSTTNHAIITSVANMIYGKGIDALDSATKTDEYAALKSIFNNECLRKICLDLKLLGEASFQVIYQNGRVHKAEHFPRQTLRPEKMDDEGEIKGYYYSADWAKVKQGEELKRIAAFGYGNKVEPEIKVIRKYVSGFDYTSLPDYIGGTAYAEMESDISDYLINDIQCGFSGTKVINFNNGVPDREKQLQVKQDIMNKLSGSLGEKIIVAFNNNAESKTTVDDLPLNDAPAHYEYLARECANKLIVAHKVTSPLLLGIRTENQGLGSNADEIKTAALLFDNITIKPYQELIIDSMDQILAVNDISLKLYFKTLQPLSFIETDNAVTDEAREEETGVKLSENNLNDAEAFDLIKDLGEDEQDLFEQGYVIIDERPVDLEEEDFLDQQLELARVPGAGNATKKSSLDDVTDSGRKYIVRYQYSPLSVSNNSREFCRKMVAAKKVYRKEDLDKQSGANSELAAKGESTYNLFLYKGGANCKHIFLRKTYYFESDGVKTDPNNPNAKNRLIYRSKRSQEGITAPSADQESPLVSTRPIDMPNKGYKNPR